MHHKALYFLAHFFGCLLFLSIPLLLAPVPFSLYLLHHPRTREELFTYALLLGFFYLNYYYLIPRYYAFNKKKFYYLFLILILAFITLVPRALIHPGPENIPVGIRFTEGLPPFRPHHFFDLFEISHHVFLFFAIVFLSLSIYINNKWKQALRGKVTAELAYLKSQINPHFLFNTLNSIYSLAIQKSDDTPEAIVKLSGLMRYVITDATEDVVPLEKEIIYIKNYIELQKIRLGNTATVQLEITDDNSGSSITPLLLIPFIENAFNHGVNPEENSTIRIQLRINKSVLHLTVFNLKVKRASHAVSTGLGIENARMRLQLLYPDKHQLQIISNHTEYQVDLTIQI
ncbi:MAG: sensor histidine kinase [Bacteroidota bacterium]